MSGASSIEMPLSKLLHIQFLRGLAALSVAFLHAQHDAGSLAARTGQAFEPFTRLPFMAGVDVFFVISGFIMVYASRPLFGKPEARGIFLARRLARIAPLYWAVTTLYLAIALDRARRLEPAAAFGRNGHRLLPVRPCRAG